MSAPHAGRSPHPRALVIWCLAALIAGFITTNPLHRIAILLVALNVCIALSRRGSPLGGVAAGVGIAGVVAVLVNLLTSHSGAHVLATIPAIPGIGGPVTLESMVYGLTIAAGVASAVLSAAPLALALEPDDLVDALPRGLERTGAALGSGLAALPRLVQTASALRDAHRTRGWKDNRREPLRAVLIPALLTAVEDSVQLAEAMEARGFGAVRRTSWIARAWTRRDAVVVAASLAAIAVTFAARMRGLMPDWYPYPAITVPPFPLFTVVVALLLLTPVVVWQRTS